MTEKMKRQYIKPIVVLLLFFGLLSAFVLLPREERQVQARLIELGEKNTTTGFARADGPRPPAFPLDNGPHESYKTEWWYYTGNLATADGLRFGFQLTFFRRALAPPSQRQDRLSPWAADQIYMAHFAVTDVAGNRHRAFERFSRGAAGLAGAEASPYRVWLEDWSVEEIKPNRYRLLASQDDLQIDLNLTDQKGPVLQGDKGYSRKGPDRGNASYYYSLTRLVSSGTLRVKNRSYEVNGLSWMDHEFSTSALGPELVGWDWFSIQLDDGSELMVYQFRKEDGTADPFSSGTYVDFAGNTTRLGHQDFAVMVKETWRSPHSGATYPAQWTITVPSEELTLDVTPYLADQELDVSFIYWEGAVKIVGERASNAVSGNGYVELTGYAKSMQNQF